MVEKDAILGCLVSVGLHAAVLALLLITFPVSMHSIQPEDIKVELVPPFQARPEQKTDGAAQVEAKQKAFETAADAEKENAKINPVKPSEQEDSDISEPAESAIGSHQDEAVTREPVLSAKNSPTSLVHPVKAETKMVKAEKIYSKDALSNPNVKQALGKLSPTDRVIQICGIEALEQIRHKRPDITPDMMARKGGNLTESSLKMFGGAFRSHANWYNLDFDCKINPQDLTVSSFQYAIGDLIPKKDWSRRELPID
ncbi:DUF930 domain-containing protein [Brucella gallinifaecis]|uniref:DUF930 domain-containing protein n=1 Tax=Brucella gallinifaecis TaxID=215590 RepID=A0A502BVP8_9HYPH|nr:DUF930 domain-containing protein [Brucella gallinifaecis]TPF77053.1 DUF930 domain-containing protein [Brucella gallinifaecis]